MGTAKEVAPTPELALDRAIKIANKAAACGPRGSKAPWLRRIWPSIRKKQARSQKRMLYHTRDFREGRDSEAEGRLPVYHGN
jgi:enoyl-CoA hydratase